MQKKVSLFKQKMLEKQQKSQVAGSFPVANKIPIIDIENELYQAEIVNQVKQQSTQSTILQQMSKLVPENQMLQIQAENSKLINNLTSQQIKQYQQMIMNQIPRQFLDKLAKNQQKKPQSTINDLIKHKEACKRQKQSQGVEKMEQQQIKQAKQQMVAQQQPKQQQINDQLANMKMQQYSDRKQQTEQEFISELFINPQTANLTISNQQSCSTQLLTLANLKLLIKSDNNQSQIIGPDLFFSMLKNVMGKEQAIITIETVRCVKWKFIRSLWKFFYMSIQKVLLETKFKSCWISVLERLIQIIDSISKYLTLQEKKNILSGISKIHNLHQSQIMEAKIQQSVLSATSLLTIQQSQPSIIDIENQTNIKEAIQLIILEESSFNQKTSKWHYLSNLFYSLKNCANMYAVINYFFNLVLQLQLYFQKACHLQLRQSGVDKLVKNHLKELYILRFGKLEVLQNSDNQIYFKILFMVKELDEEIFQTYVQKFNQDNNMSPIKTMLITYLSLKCYQQGEISSQELNNINLIFQYISSVLPSVPFWSFLNNLLILYQNPTAPYNQATIQKKMDNCLSLIINKCSKNQLQNMFDVQKVKSLIQKYNFSSFGSHSFTKLMFLITLLDSQYEKLITEQILYRYPFLFYYVFQEDPPYTFKNLHSQQYIKDEKTFQKQDIAEMFVKDEKLNKRNLFYRYLTCDI